MRESVIVHQNCSYWVYDSGKAYEVRKDGVTCSTTESAYAHTPDGLSIAKARCDYLARRAR